MAGAMSRELEHQLEPAREFLEMELAYVTEFCRAQEVYVAAAGDGRPFGIEEGMSVPLDRGWGSGVVDGSVPCVIRDTSSGCGPELEAARAAGIRSLVGVPVRLSDGRLFGSLCCSSRWPNEWLGWRDVRFLEIVARSVGNLLWHALEKQQRRMRIESTAVGALLAALQARDRYTSRHSDAVVELALDVARDLGLGEDEVRAVGQVALLHDIGKIGVPDAILQKPDALDELEWDVMRTHPELGAQMLASVEELAHLAAAVRAEHERWDGCGYPDGLSGEEIPIASRIVLACDAFHAMTSDRPYRAALGREAAIGELERGSGSQFCPATLEALLGKIDRVEELVPLLV